MQKNDIKRRKLEGNWNPPKQSGYEPEDMGTINIDGIEYGWDDPEINRKVERQKRRFRLAIMRALRDLLSKDDVDDVDKEIAWDCYLDLLKSSDDEVWNELAELRKDGGM